MKEAAYDLMPVGGVLVDSTDHELPVELHEGAEVEVQIKLPSGTRTAHAIVRHRNVYRHGFEFVQP